jgi:uncharacterized RmlC-like cupin family protein
MTDPTVSGDAFHRRLHQVTPADMTTETAQTPGMIRLAAISGAAVGSRQLWMGQTHVAPGTVSAAHHHGESETAIYVVSGTPSFVFLGEEPDEAPQQPGEAPQENMGRSDGAGLTSHAGQADRADRGAQTDPAERAGQADGAGNGRHIGGTRERRINARPGDFIYVPPYLPHREENPDPAQAAVVVIARSTQEAIVINLPDLGWEQGTGQGGRQ